jgi:hypothetical protein
MLDAPDWLERRDRHRGRVEALLGPRLRQRAVGQPNPVVDFLFNYYNFTPGRLRRWHPGFGVVLTGPQAQGYRNLRGYRQFAVGVAGRVGVDPDHLGKRRGTVDYVSVDP